MPNQAYSQRAKNKRKAAAQQRRESIDKPVDTTATSKGSTANKVRSRRQSMKSSIDKILSQ